MRQIYIFSSYIIDKKFKTCSQTASLTSPQKDIKQSKDLFNGNSPDKSFMAEIAALQSQIQDLQIEVDILKETIDVLKKDQGVK